MVGDHSEEMTWEQTPMTAMESLAPPPSGGQVGFLEEKSAHVVGLSYAVSG